MRGKSNMKHRITATETDGTAAETGIESGDFLISINGKIVHDVFDFRFLMQSEEILLEVEKPDGEIWELLIEKDMDDDLGLVFESALMSPKRLCENNCIFCFIDQEPPGLRDSLYVKDDDIRLSFLHGNYVTLTNMDMDEVRRIAGYHLSPLRISIHAADADVRVKMMRQKKAADVFEKIEILSAAGIEMHFQAVLCRGWNDGEILDETIAKLSTVKGAASLAIVPAGLTEHREGLELIQPFDFQSARAVVDKTEAKQNAFRVQRGNAFVYLADEWYILSERPLPNYDEYDGFPQLDNGVGMLKLFEHEFLAAMEEAESTPTTVRAGIITGLASAEFMSLLMKKFMAKFPHFEVSVFPVFNNFYGENITVSGLLTGADIISQLSGFFEGETVFLPANVFDSTGKYLLDGKTAKDLSRSLSINIKAVPTDGAEFFEELIALAR